jgi:L-iditol 2-dehydrogenase
VAAAAPGATVVLVGGCAAGTEAPLPTDPLHYDELDVRGSFHHSAAEVDRALALLDAGDVDWRAFAGPVIGLDGLASALARPTEGPARKVVVEPARV